MGLRVQLLGRFSVWRDDVLVKRWDADQTKTLLKILLTERGQIFLCDQLIEYLWPDYEDYEQALHFLRVRIHSLRRTIEPASQPRVNYILTYPNGYAFNAEADCTIDTEELNNIFEQAEALVKHKEYEPAMIKYEKAVSLYLGEYLPENRYDEWANIERNKYSQIYVNALLGFAECLARQGEYRRAGDLCRKALAVNKYNEDIYRQSMTYNYLMGNHAEAIRLYQECEQILAEGLEVKPSTATRLLYENIVNGKVSEIDPSYPIPKPVQHPIHHSLGRLPFVGRERECGRLFASLEEASKGKGRMILIGGEAGVGKTRLIREVIQHAREQFKTVALIGQCTVLGSKQPYQSLLMALQAYLVTLSGKTFEDVLKFVSLVSVDSWSS